MGGFGRPARGFGGWAGVAALVAAVAVPQGAQAEDQGPTGAGVEAPAADGPPVGLEPSPMDLLFPDQRSRHTSLGINTLRFAPKQEALTTIYTEVPWRFGLAVGVFPTHRIHPRLEVGLIHMNGLAIGQFSGEASDEVSTMWVFPTEAGVEYLFDYSWEQVLVPFVGAGADAYPWREDAAGISTTGVKWGAHGTVGLMLRLNFMETTTHWGTGGGFLPSDAGLSVRLTYAKVDSFGRGGLDFSGLQFGFGGMVAF